MLNSNSIQRIYNNILQRLQSCGIEDASLEASLILEAYSPFDRLERLRRPWQELTSLQIKQVDAAVRERCKHRPLSHILKESYFYGRAFYINENVLTPRPDSEILLEAVIGEIKKRCSKSEEGIALLDSCTGSGCIGISLWLEIEEEYIINKLDLIDISAAALEVAKYNADKHSLPESKISFKNCDLWPDTQESYDVITCNPPYISQGDMKQLMPEVDLYEPHLALYGGRDGLDFYRRLAAEATNYLNVGGILALEHAYDQREAIKSVFAGTQFALQAEADDYGGNARVLIFALPPEEN